MAEPDPILKVPESQANRQAIDALGGYVYQAYATGLAWLALAPDETLQLEVAEDYARVARDAVEMTQVKRTGGAVTLRSKGVRQVLDGYWAFAQANPERMVRSILLTTSEASRERPSPLPAGVRGLQRWSEEAETSLSEPLLALLRDLDLAADLKTWLATASAEEIHAKLIRRVSWRLGAPGGEALKLQFDRAVVARGQRLRLVPEEARRGAVALLMTIIQRSCEAGSRTLEAGDVDEVLQSANLVHVTPAYVRQLGAAVEPYTPPLSDRTRDDPAGRLFFFGAADRVKFLGRAAERDRLVDWAQRGGGLSWTLVTGVGGMGKSRLALEVCRELFDAGWHAGFLSPGSAATTPDRFMSFRPSKPTFMVIDYVSLAASWTGEVIRTLMDVSAQRPFEVAVRVLLLERTGAASPWWEAFHAGQLSKMLGGAVRLGGPSFLDLRGFDRDERWDLFERVAGKQGESDRKRIERSLEKIDPKSTPLFTSLAAEARRAGRKIWQFDRNGLLHDIFEREQQRWSRLSNGPDDLARHELATALATMVGGLLLTEGRDHATTPQFPFGDGQFNRRLAEAITGPPPSGNQFIALEPDILGEWFTLRELQGEHGLDTRPAALRGAATTLAAVSAQRRFGFAGFRVRLAQDFPAEALASELYAPPPPDAPASTVASWMTVLANVLEDLKPHVSKPHLRRLLASVIEARERLRTYKEVQVSATAFIGVYAAIQVDEGLIDPATELLDRLDWLPGDADFTEAARELSRAGYAVGRALAERGEVRRAFILLERMRTQAEDFRETVGADWREMLRFAAMLGIAMWSQFKEEGSRDPLAAIERILWEKPLGDREDLALAAAEVLSESAVDEGIVYLDAALAELEGRTRQRRDLPVLARITAEALLAAVRDESDDDAFIARGYRLSGWVRPRPNMAVIRPVLEEAAEKGFLDPTGRIGPLILERLEHVWRVTYQAALDAGRDPEKDPEVGRRRRALLRGLEEVADAAWANAFRERAKA